MAHRTLGLSSDELLNVGNIDNHTWHCTVVNVYLFFRRIYVFNSIEINMRSDKVCWIFSRLWNIQTSLNNHIRINSPYVQTTKGQTSPPKKDQTSAVLQAMLVQTLIRGKTSSRKRFPVNTLWNKMLKYFRTYSLEKSLCTRWYRFPLSKSHSINKCLFWYKIVKIKCDRTF